jgi:hypothetical protein
VDLISVSALVPLLTKISDGTAAKAGEQQWESLSAAVRRLFGRRSTSVEAVKRLGERPGDPDSIRALARALVDDSGRDPQAAAQLRHWLAAAEQAISANQSVADTVNSPVRGLRKRDTHGDITF